jgi:hypothetical protein
VKTFATVMWLAAGAAGVVLAGALYSRKQQADAGPVPEGGAYLTEMLSSGDQASLDAKVGDLVTIVGPVGWPAPTADGSALVVTSSTNNHAMFRATTPGVSRVSASNGSETAMIDVTVSA